MMKMDNEMLRVAKFLTDICRLGSNRQQATTGLWIGA